MPIVSPGPDGRVEEPVEISAPNWIAFYAWISGYTIFCLAFNAWAFAQGFPAAIPLFWLHGSLVFGQTMLGLAMLLVTLMFVSMDVAVFLMNLPSRLRYPEEWKRSMRLIESRNDLFFRSLKRDRRRLHFARVFMAACGTALLWPIVRILFWP